MKLIPTECVRYLKKPSEKEIDFAQKLHFTYEKIVKNNFLSILFLYIAEMCDKILSNFYNGKKGVKK